MSGFGLRLRTVERHFPRKGGLPDVVILDKTSKRPEGFRAEDYETVIYIVPAAAAVKASRMSPSKLSDKELSFQIEGLKRRIKELQG